MKTSIKEIITRSSRTDYILRATKNNLIEVDGEIVRPRKVEVWKSGKAVLWWSPKKGKGYSQNSFGIVLSEYAISNNEIEMHF